MIRFMCPRCKAVLEQPDNAAGQKMACPACNQRLQVPLPAENKTVLGSAVENAPPLSAAAGSAVVEAVPVTPAPGGAELPAPAAASARVQIRLVMGREHIFWPCPLCQNQVDVPQDLGQLAVRCPHCARKIEVPYPQGAPPRRAPPPPSERPPPPPPPPRSPAPYPPDPPLSREVGRSRYDDDWDRPPPRRRYEDDYYGPPRYRRSGQSPDQAARAAVAGLICSMISLGLLLVTLFIWVLAAERRSTAESLLCLMLIVVGASFVLGLLGTIFSSRGLYPENVHNRGAAVAGLVCGIIGLVISSLVGFILLVAVMFWLDRPRRF